MPPRAKKDAFLRDLLAKPFPEEWETWLLANMTHYRLLSDKERACLHDDTRALFAEKSWEGCDRLKVTDIMKLTVAAQAALLLLGLEHDHFSRVLSIVLFPTEFELPAESWEENGRVVTGSAVDYGTVFLSWETVLTEGRDPLAGHNLVIHEFAHQLDFLDGYTNGVPPLRNLQQTERWQQVMHATFNRLRRDLQKGRRTFLGSYAATNPTEFFSVASEKFFTLPHQLREFHRELFEVLSEYYRVDPLRWFEGFCSSERSKAKEAVESVSSSPSVPLEEMTVPSTEIAEKVRAKDSETVIELDFIDFKCPYCKSPISFPKTDAGTLKQCHNCLDSMIVPDHTGDAAQRIPFPIRTERLVLRRFETLDAKDLADLMANPDTLRYLAWTAMTLEEVEEWIAEQSGIRFPQPTNYCHFAIEAIQAAKVIGLMSFWFPHEEFDLAQFEAIIHPKWQGKGYATEAIRCILAYAFKDLCARRIIAECDARNPPARRLLLRAGLRQESERIQDRFVKGEWVNTVGFALLKQEYEARAGNP
jgi:MtfA peptidase